MQPHGRAMIGKTISHYRIVEKLGGGGMNCPFAAEQISSSSTHNSSRRYLNVIVTLFFSLNTNKAHITSNS
jgi:hypothetical protein